MKTIGLFTRQDIKAGLPAARKGHDKGLNQLPAASLWRVGLKGVAGMNPNAKHPAMPPVGSSKPLVYVLGEAPGENEDHEGVPFVGKAGQLLRPLLRGFGKRVRINNVVRTRPPKNRVPTFSEIECFRPSLIEDIEQTKPKAIIGTGATPMHWALGHLKNLTIGLARGRRFPIKVGKHACWFYPVHHPSFLLRLGDDGDRKESQWRRVWKRDFERVGRDVESKFAMQAPAIELPNEKGVTLLTGEPGDLAKLEQQLHALARKRRVVFDFETNGRPYTKGYKVLSLSIGTSSRVVAFAVDHPEAKWSKQERVKVLKLMKWFFTKTKPTKIAHNLNFDLEVLVNLFGWMMARASKWGCTMQQSYVLDGRKNGHGLNFLSLLHLGFKLKEYSDVDRKKLAGTPLKRVLKYNAWDSKYTYPIFIKQHDLIKQMHLRGIYREHMARVPTMVLTQTAGFPIDQRARKRLAKQYGKRIKKAMRVLRHRKEIKRYEKRYGTFQPTSTPSVAKLLQHVMKRGEGVQESGRYSCKESVLRQIGGPMVEAILTYRKLTKAKSTYIDPLDPDYRKNKIWPDGFVHPQFNSTRTDTGRTSANDPSVQNFPMRNPETRRIRLCFSPRQLEEQGILTEPHVVVAVDYGQLEFRGIAMLSRDRQMIKYCWDDYDVHAYWAKRIIKAYPKTFEQRCEERPGYDFKGFRSDVKNQFVFPSFYGAQPPSIARSLDMPVRLLERIWHELWDDLPGVLAWQKELIRFYNTNGYVATATGRRWYVSEDGPLTTNEVINGPVQGSCSDIVVDAWNKLSIQAVATGRHYLQGRLNIHDDLTFLVPKRKLESALCEIVPAMLDTKYKWARVVPLLAEVKVGDNWFDLREIGKFRSDQLN